jgi:hypothetical protein
MNKQGGNRMTKNDNHSFDAIAVVCGDGRLTRTIGAQLAEKFGIVDMTGGPGSIRDIIDDSKTYIFENIDVYLSLHNNSKIILTMHEDCGAFGGIAAHNNDRAEEFSHYKELLNEAKKKVMDRYPNVEVVLVYISLKDIGDRKFETSIEVIS